MLEQAEQLSIANLSLQKARDQLLPKLMSGQLGCLRHPSARGGHGMTEPVASWSSLGFAGGHSDYIVYVDESGDHSLTSIDPDYPVFVLSFCIFRKAEYAQTVTPVIRNLKFATFGHDMVVLHEADIRRKKGAFSRLSKEPREAFERADRHHRRSRLPVGGSGDRQAQAQGPLQQPRAPLPPGAGVRAGAHIGVQGSAGQDNALTYIVCEARGAKEDAELSEFRRIRDGANYFHRPLPFDLIIADKKTNSEGLQLADLTARPIGLTVLRPEQANRAAEVLEGKFYRTRLAQAGHGAEGVSVSDEKPNPRKQKGAHHFQNWYAVFTNEDFAPVALLMFLLATGWYGWTFATMHRFTNMSALLYTGSVITFMMGLISEQITALMYRD